MTPHLGGINLSPEKATVLTKFKSTQSVADPGGIRPWPQFRLAIDFGRPLVTLKVEYVRTFTFLTFTQPNVYMQIRLDHLCIVTPQLSLLTHPLHLPYRCFPNMECPRCQTAQSSLLNCPFTVRFIQQMTPFSRLATYCMKNSEIREPIYNFSAGAILMIGITAVGPVDTSHTKYTGNN